MKRLEQGSSLVYTERVGGSNPSPPTSHAGSMYESSSRCSDDRVDGWDGLRPKPGARAEIWGSRQRQVQAGDRGGEGGRESLQEIARQYSRSGAHRSLGQRAEREPAKARGEAVFGKAYENRTPRQLERDANTCWPRPQC